VVWIRYTLLTAQILNEIDECKDLARDESIQGKVDEFCTRMQGLMEEWKLETTMNEDKSDDQRYLFADHVMTIYAVIIGVRRLVRRPGSPVDAITLGAARKVAQVTIDFAVGNAPTGEAQSVCIQWVALTLHANSSP
jgi:hypothetical protein